MSIEHLRAVNALGPVAGATARAVLVQLADMANDEGWAWPSHATLGARTELSRRAVQSALERLEAAGAIEVQRKWGASSRYRVTVEGVTTAGDAHAQEMHVRTTRAGDAQEVRRLGADDACAGDARAQEVRMGCAGGAQGMRTTCALSPNDPPMIPQGESAARAMDDRVEREYRECRALLEARPTCDLWVNGKSARAEAAWRAQIGECEAGYVLGGLRLLLEAEAGGDAWARVQVGYLERTPDSVRPGPGGTWALRRAWEQYGQGGAGAAVAQEAVQADPQAEAAWEDVRRALEAEMEESQYHEFVRDTRGVRFDGDVLVVEAPSAFHRDWLTSNCDAELLGRAVTFESKVATRSCKSNSELQRWRVLPGGYAEGR